MTYVLIAVVHTITLTATYRTHEECAVAVDVLRATGTTAESRCLEAP